MTINNSKMNWYLFIILGFFTITTIDQPGAYATVKTDQLQYDLVIRDVKKGIELGPDGYIYVPTFNEHLFAFQPEN
jgi:hypothetical protein